MECGRMLYSAADMEQLVLDWGFLPFFRNSIPGFSIEEHTPGELWFSKGREGPWERKAALAGGGRCAYGKFFGKKAGFVSMELFPDFANVRRDGSPFAEQYADGMISRQEKQLYDAITEQGSLISRELKRLCGYGRGGSSGFDPLITRLQMQTYVLCANFELPRNKHGLPYGWALTRYSTPEALFGSGFTTQVYRRAPWESRARLNRELQRRLPQLPAPAIQSFLE